MLFFSEHAVSLYPGDFRNEADGDKSVAYLFSNPYTGIIFEKTLMPLLDAIGDTSLKLFFMTIIMKDQTCTSELSHFSSAQFAAKTHNFS